MKLEQGDRLETEEKAVYTETLKTRCRSHNEESAQRS
jgi:hypothetical protein